MDKVTLKELQLKCKRIGLKGYSGKKKEQLVNMLYEYHKNNNIKVSEFSKKRYKYIFHTADIHIRPLERHDEYVAILIEMMKAIGSKGKESLLVICGDLFHHKTNITANMLLLSRNLFKKLSTIIDVLIIPGNHDIASLNRKRVDTITGVLDGTSENIYYLKETGVYYCDNLIFAVDSFLDNKKIYYDSIPHNILPNRISISLYHGIVQGCGVPSSGEVKKLSDFDCFEMVLLGDVHKRQILKEKNPYIAYPGSLIQQNFGEELVKGICEYNLETGEKKFIRLKNNYAFFTLEVGSNIIPKEIEDYKGLYLRIIVPHSTNLTDVEKFVKNIKKKYNILKIKYKYLEKEIIENDTMKSIEKHEDDITMIKKELDIRNVPDIVKKNILSLHESLKKEFSSEDLFYQDWKLYKLEFKNILIYGGNKINTIDFKNGLLLLNGENASGKSSIINIITHVLFDQGNLKSMCNKREKAYFIKAYLNVGMDKYIILREGKVHENIKKNKTEIIIWKNNNKLLKGSRILAYKKLKDLLGTKTDFNLTNIYNNTNSGSILTMKNSERIISLNNLFKIEIYSKLEKSIKNKVKDVIRDKNILTGEVNMLGMDLNKYKDILKDEKDILKDDKNFRIIEKELIELKSKIDKKYGFHKGEIPLNHSEYKEETIRDLKNRYYNLRDKIVPISKKNVKYTDKELKDLENKIDWELKIRENAESILLKYEMQLDNLKYDESLLIDGIKENKISLTTLNQEPKQKSLISDEYKDMKSKDLKDIINILKKDISEHKNNKIVFKETYLKLRNILKKDRKSYPMSKDALIKICNLMEYRDKYGDEISDKKIELSEVENTFKAIEENKKVDKVINSINYLKYMHVINEIEPLKKEIKNHKDKELYNNIKRIITIQKLNDKIEKEIKELREDIKKRIPIRNRLLKDKIDKLSKEYEKKKDSIIRNERRKEALEKNKLYSEKNKKLDMINNKLGIYQLYLSLIHKQCIPLKLLSEKIKGIEIYVNDFLDNLVEYKCIIEYKEKKLNIYCVKDQSVFDINQLSGYETFILNLAFKRALNRYSFINRSKMICIDEGWDCIDENNFEKLNILFDKLKRDFSIVLVITHIINMKKMINERIMVKKINKDFSIITKSSEE